MLAAFAASTLALSVALLRRGSGAGGGRRGGGRREGHPVHPPEGVHPAPARSEALPDTLHLADPPDHPPRLCRQPRRQEHPFGHLRPGPLGGQPGLPGRLRQLGLLLRRRAGRTAGRDRRPARPRRRGHGLRRSPRLRRQPRGGATGDRHDRRRRLGEPVGLDRGQLRDHDRLPVHPEDHPRRLRRGPRAAASSPCSSIPRSGSGTTPTSRAGTS
ncbi:MAG: hypothetical protein M0C28_38005 [Candidatus Moduliflexus flocculans]|nr:hypothetical protein [Candidatus Moduliflexus flocculans]